MNTIKLYQKDVDLCQCESRLLSLICDPAEMASLGAKKQENTFLAVLDQTVFFPEGGGQPCDIGFIDGYPVFFVFEGDGIVYHQLSAPATDVCSFLKIEEPVSQEDERAVHCEIDRSRRFLHMQMHCGEHILSGMFYQEFGGVNRGFHMGDGCMTIDISLEEKPEFTEFTQDMIDHAELLANRAVWADAPVTVRHFQTQEEAACLPLRKKLAVEKDITIVCVGSPENPADCVACCGTHPKTAGAVGLIKIIKSESYKGMTRFHVKAGQPAFADYALKHRLVTRLCGQYSAEPEMLPDKMKTQDTKNGAVRKELYDLKKTLISQQADNIEDIYKTELFQVSTPIVIKRYDYLSIDDLQTLGRRVTMSVKGLLLLVAEQEHTVLLVSRGKPDCGKLVRENASIYQGKGGGNDTLARAIFTKPDSLNTYLDLLEKHLR